MPLLMRFCLGTDSDVFRDALSIRDRVFVEEQGVPLALEHDGKEAEALHFVAYSREDGGDEVDSHGARHRLVPAAAARVRRVTHCGFRAYTEPIAKVERVCVMRAYRGKGCGVELMRFVEQKARDMFGKVSLTLHSRLNAKSFYTRLGYTVSSEVFTEAGLQHLCMSKL